LYKLQAHLVHPTSGIERRFSIKIKEVPNIPWDDYKKEYSRGVLSGIRVGKEVDNILVEGVFKTYLEEAYASWIIKSIQQV
jgi:hypothetical protein